MPSFLGKQYKASGGRRKARDGFVCMCLVVRCVHTLHMVTQRYLWAEPDARQAKCHGHGDLPKDIYKRRLFFSETCMSEAIPRHVMYLHVP